MVKKDKAELLHASKHWVNWGRRGYFISIDYTQDVNLIQKNYHNRDDTEGEPVETWNEAEKILEKACDIVKGAVKLDYTILGKV